MSWKLILGILFLFVSAKGHTYPLDGFDETNIRRLEGYFYSLPTESGRQLITAGALLSISEVSVGSQRVGSFPPVRDSFLQEGLNRIVRKFGDEISLALLDLSDKEKLAYAGSNDTASFVPGSVGKIMVAASLFDALARLYPSIETRERILREHMIVADNFINDDSHVVPFWSEDTRTIYYRPLQLGDKANLWSYLDWMLSASSNAAASMVMREVLLMNYLGDRYTTSSANAEILNRLPSTERSSLMKKSFIDPLKKLSLTPGRLFQVSFFTKDAKATIPGLGSSATAKDLVQLLFLIEKGELIDYFSSLELKRLLYLTQKRERYVGTTVLNDTAAYFKAGSFWRCRPESNFHCGKYEGNLTNILNGAAIIESPLANPSLRYIVAVSTNVLRKNSEELHQALAEEVHHLISMRSKKD